MEKVGENRMEDILEKIDNFSLEIYLIAGELLGKAINAEGKEKKLLLNASKLFQDISIALKTTWQELKEAEPLHMAIQ